jgi:hypothetical protein
VLERETTTTGARTATAACRLGCFSSHWLVDTSWGCAFGVGGPRELFWEGGRWFGGRARNDDDGGRNGYPRVSFRLYHLVLVDRHLLGVRFRVWKAGGKGSSRGEGGGEVDVDVDPGS